MFMVIQADNVNNVFRIVGCKLRPSFKIKYIVDSLDVDRIF
jgi:hypothetical protein